MSCCETSAIIGLKVLDFFDMSYTDDKGQLLVAIQEIAVPMLVLHKQVQHVMNRVS